MRSRFAKKCKYCKKKFYDIFLGDGIFIDEDTTIFEEGILKEAKCHVIKCKEIHNSKKIESSMEIFP